MGGGLLVGLPAGQERDARHRGRHAALEQANGFLRDLFDAGLLAALLAGDRHVGLQDHAFQRHALHAQFLERLVEHALRHLVAAVDVVVAVHQHFRLDDRHDLRLLAQRRVARKRVRIDADRGHGRDAGADIDHRPPFREARALVVIFFSRSAVCRGRQ